MAEINIIQCTSNYTTKNKQQQEKLLEIILFSQRILLEGLMISAVIKCCEKRYLVGHRNKTCQVKTDRQVTGGYFYPKPVPMLVSFCT